jgi:hypothetical protein
MKRDDDRRQPWIKWYPADWRADPRLRICSYAARGLWADMISLMHEAEPYGHLLIAGMAPTPKQLASVLGGSEREVKALLMELQQAGVFSLNDDDVIYSRRMVRDKAKADVDKSNGGKGGNPRLKGTHNAEDNGGVNPEDKAQRLEARRDSPERKKDSEAKASGANAPASPIDLKAELWRVGKAFLTANGKSTKDAGSLLGQWRKQYGDQAVLDAMATCQATAASEPIAFIVKTLERRGRGVVNGTGPPKKPLGPAAGTPEDLEQRRRAGI